MTEFSVSSHVLRLELLDMLLAVVSIHRELERVLTLEQNGPILSRCPPLSSFIMMSARLS